MNISESIVIALNSIVANKLRASLTLLSIAIGVFAIMGAGTLVTSFNNTVTGELAQLGENSFSITRMPTVNIGTGDSWRKYRGRKRITYSQYMDLRNTMQTTDFISAHSSSSANVIKYENFETDPDVNIMGTDENFFFVNNYNVEFGRAFATHDILYNRNFAIIGNDVKVKLFPSQNPIGQDIRIGNQFFNVIGVLESKGALMGRSQDNLVIVPLPQFLRYIASRWEEDLTIGVRAYSRESLDESIDEAIGIMRSLRNVKPWEDNSFEILTNESLKDQFSSLTGYLTIFGFISGLIALIAAGVGIMNIMLVSIKERTREIGVRKAVGAKRRWIMYQFIIETITLCQVGGFFGILLGIGGAGIFSQIMNLKLSLPLEWILFSIIICTILGLVSGAYPAWKAAKLDPIEALRYE